MQSVATRLVVERERERWGSSPPATGTSSRRSTLARSPRGSRGRRSRVAQGRDFGRDGALKSKTRCARRGRCRGLAARSTAPSSRVASVEEKPYTRRPAAPFMTSTLQQEASRKLRLSSQQTMRVAQRLYENGYITYMRTDSTTLSESALTAARDQARDLYGADSVPDAAAPVRAEGEERAGGARGDPSGRRHASARRTTSAASSRATSSSSTT